VTDTNVFQLSQPGTFADPLTEVLRNGARALLAQAVEAEVAALLNCHADKLTDDGRQRLVRHGHLPRSAYWSLSEPRKRSGWPRPRTMRGAVECLKGSRRAARLLRLPGGVVEASAHD
jgi:hypothetical protein